MRYIWNDARWVARTPVISVMLLESANVGQLWRMWTVGSSLGQNLWSWVAVQGALWLWLNFYRVLVPKEERRFAFWGTALGIALNGAVCLTVWHFRMLGR